MTQQGDTIPDEFKQRVLLCRLPFAVQPEHRYTCQRAYRTQTAYHFVVSHTSTGGGCQDDQVDRIFW